MKSERQVKYTMTNRKEILMLKKSEGNWDREEKMADFENVCNEAGIWTLKGMKSNEEKYHYLEVAETKCIIEEIRKDITLINKKYSEEEIKKNIIRRRKKVFAWSEQLEETSLPRRAEKFREISENYIILCFELLEFEKNEEERRKKEAEFAVNNQVKYWRPIKEQWKLDCVSQNFQNFKDS